MLRTLAIANYRSLRDVVVPLARLTIITGPNGSGKSSLYRALRLLADTAQGRLVSSLAREGGLPSTLWAGPETLSREMKAGAQKVQGGPRNRPIHLALGFGCADFSFAIDLGLPTPSITTAFALDPEIKRECIWAGPVFRPASVLIDRRGPTLRAADESGAIAPLPGQLSLFESMMTEFSDPRSAPELPLLRDRIRSWRFYDQLRTDADAPARQPQVATFTPVLHHDGSNVAAALQTIREIGDAEGLDATVADAFPGSKVLIEGGDGRLQASMQQPGMLRPLSAGELSDGTLRYLLLIAALMTPRPPALLVLNEPETSLHPDLIAPLARLIAAAGENSQVIVVSHNDRLVSTLLDQSAAQPIVLAKTLGETHVEGQGQLDRPAWRWPPR